jgi:hypothetical protein
MITVDRENGMIHLDKSKIRTLPLHCYAHYWPQSTEQTDC